MQDHRAVRRNDGRSAGRLCFVAVPAILLLTLLTSSARAALDVRVEFYDANGQLIEGQGTVHGLAGAVPGFELVNVWLAGIDEGTGQPSGKLQMETLGVRVPIGPHTVRLHDAMSQNGQLERVVFRFFRSNRLGTVEEFYRITVHDVSIEGIHTEMLDNQFPATASLPVTSVVRLLFQEFETEGGGGVVIERLRFIRGDTNDDLAVDISDALRLLFFLFQGTPLRCELAADINGDAELDLSDVTYVLQYLFLRGPPIPAPGGCEVVPPGAACETTACDPQRG